jgi:hypothetical protein
MSLIFRWRLCGALVFATCLYSLAMAGGRYHGVAVYRGANGGYVYAYSGPANTKEEARDIAKKRCNNNEYGYRCTARMDLVVEGGCLFIAGGRVKRKRTYESNIGVGSSRTQALERCEKGGFECLTEDAKGGCIAEEGSSERTPAGSVTLPNEPKLAYPVVDYSQQAKQQAVAEQKEKKDADVKEALADWGSFMADLSKDRSASEKCGLVTSWVVELRKRRDLFGAASGNATAATLLPVTTKLTESMLGLEKSCFEKKMLPVTDDDKAALEAIKSSTDADNEWIEAARGAMPVKGEDYVDPTPKTCMLLGRTAGQVEKAKAAVAKMKESRQKLVELQDRVSAHMRESLERTLSDPSEIERSERSLASILRMRKEGELGCGGGEYDCPIKDARGGCIKEGEASKASQPAAADKGVWASNCGPLLSALTQARTVLDKAYAAHTALVPECSKARNDEREQLKAQINDVDKQYAAYFECAGVTPSDRFQEQATYKKQAVKLSDATSACAAEMKEDCARGSAMLEKAGVVMKSLTMALPNAQSAEDRCAIGKSSVMSWNAVMREARSGHAGPCFDPDKIEVWKKFDKEANNLVKQNCAVEK